MKAPAVRDLAVEIAATVAAPLATTFDVFAPIDVPSIFPGYRGLPAVVAVEGQVGGWDAPGQTRTILLADGSRLREELTVVRRPHHFAYRVSDLTGPFRHLVSGFRGAFWFEDAALLNGQRTHVRWRYEFAPRTPARRLVAVPIVRWLWKGALRQALALAGAQAEAAARGETASR